MTGDGPGFHTSELKFDDVEARFGSISNVMPGMLRGPPYETFSPVWKTRKPTWVTLRSGSPKKSTSLPKDAFSCGAASDVDLSATASPRLPLPNGGSEMVPVVWLIAYGPSRSS